MLSKFAKFSQVCSKTTFLAPLLAQNFGGVPKNEPNFLEMVGIYFEDASKYMKIPKDQLELIKVPNSTLKVNLRVTMDDGTMRSFPSWRC